MSHDEREWKEKLSPEQYRVLREKGTERPFSGALLDEKRPGIYVCAGCGTELFSADTKFDAGCGWPSFYQSLGDQVEYKEDVSMGMRRTEILCANCGGHLGHVFPDGPIPTGQRYCVNSLSLDFKAADE
ncbi:peptide-methionine (R)-S-oxide reductase [Aliidiomarina minuta]|uniref:Peptide methionine sulfoxide reductase MsrB n=1 Tax=Aliidiomarina minuta TaxID=880057 RepID=A0A432W6Y4_9GAMM|nr:peptide-methionine (R)-S-oxide reductase MsrB [Aliidiomarina minuta]RUO25726.1 peptide-methionine (R)-S-oxide reductase [Aliidiomarina minuta]